MALVVLGNPICRASPYAADRGSRHDELVPNPVLGNSEAGKEPGLLDIPLVHQLVTMRPGTSRPAVHVAHFVL